MPSKNKRINLTVSEEVYNKIQEYKLDNGFLNDASACMQLIMKQLKAEEQSKLISSLINNISEEQLNQVSAEGFRFLKNSMGTK